MGLDNPGLCLLTLLRIFHFAVLNGHDKELLFEVGFADGVSRLCGFSLLPWLACGQWPASCRRSQAHAKTLACARVLWIVDQRVNYSAASSPESPASFSASSRALREHAFFHFNLADHFVWCVQDFSAFWQFDVRNGDWCVDGQLRDVVSEFIWENAGFALDDQLCDTLGEGSTSSFLRLWVAKHLDFNQC